MITLAKEPTLANRRLAFNRLRDRDVGHEALQRAGPALQGAPGRLPAHPRSSASASATTRRWRWSSSSIVRSPWPARKQRRRRSPVRIEAKSRAHARLFCLRDVARRGVRRLLLASSPRSVRLWYRPRRRPAAPRRSPQRHTPRPDTSVARRANNERTFVGIRHDAAAWREGLPPGALGAADRCRRP
jgi:hypothetical protein